MEAEGCSNGICS